MSRSYPIHEGKRTWKELEHIIALGYSYSTVFNDFLELILSALLSLTDNMTRPQIMEKLLENKLDGIYEDSYKAIVNKYPENKSREKGKRPIDYFYSAFRELQAETKEYDKDILGEIFMTQISHGEHGQFFTPEHITNMMAQITGTPKDGETVSDPCCGSGRFFISMGRLNRNVKFDGIDLSLTCAKMTVLNMWLFDLDADIHCGDSLLMKISQTWRIRKGGYIFTDRNE